MKKLISVLILIFIILSLFSCNNAASVADGYILDGDNKVVPTDFLSIGGEKVSFSEFRYYYLNYRDMYIEENGEDYFSDAENEKKLKDEIIQLLKDSVAIKLIAKEMNISLSSEEKSKIEQDIKDTKSFYGGDAEFAEELKKSYITISLYKEMAKFSSLYSDVFKKMFEEGSENAWSDDEFLAYYRENYLAVQQIQINYLSGENKENCPETEKKAEEIFLEAKDAVNFWTVVEKYGEDANMEKNPNGYYITKGQAEDILYEKSAALSENEISSPVKAEGGIFIIKRVPMIDEEIIKNKEVALFGYTDSVTGEFISGAYGDEFEKIFSEKGDSLEVIYPEIWDKISVKTVF